MIDRTYRINDVVQSEFLRLPLTLLANPKYKQMSLEAKFIYSLLLNRMTLSQRNDWINEDNEVYLIYTREEAANTLNISYRKAISAFRELIANGLLYEQRQGLGAPNLLYVLKAELECEDATEFNKNFDGNGGEYEEKEPENPVNKQTCNFGISRTAKSAYQDVQKPHIKNCKNGTSKTADTAHQELQNPQTSKINNKNTENSYIDNSQSISQSYGNFKYIGYENLTDGQTDEHLQEILDGCELELFKENIRLMLVQAIERLYYTETLKIGNARLPQAKVRSYLNLLTPDVLMTVLQAMKVNEDRIVNPMAYLMSTIINTICEQESDLILSLPEEYVKESDFYVSPEEGVDYGNVTQNGSGMDFGAAQNVWGNEGIPSE